MSTSTEFRIEQLRTRSVQKTLESLLVLVAALFVSALLPSLLVRYLYADQQLFEQPPALEIIPVIAFVIGISYFIYAAIGNILREMEAQRLEKTLTSLSPMTSKGPVRAASMVANRKSTTTDLKEALSQASQRKSAVAGVSTTKSKIKKTTRRK